MMKKWPRAKIGMMLWCIASGLSCATSATYIVPLLKDRPLRIDIETPRTVFRYYRAKPCGIGGLFKCREGVLEYDFDLSKKEDRVKFNQMGFECQVPQPL